MVVPTPLLPKPLLPEPLLPEPSPKHVILNTSNLVYGFVWGSPGGRRLVLIRLLSADYLQIVSGGFKFVKWVCLGFQRVQIWYVGLAGSTAPQNRSSWGYKTFVYGFVWVYGFAWVICNLLVSTRLAAAIKTLYILIFYFNKYLIMFCYYLLCSCLYLHGYINNWSPLNSIRSKLAV